MALSSSSSQQTTGMLLADHHKTALILPDRCIGASGKNIMQGCWNRPEETAEVLRDGCLYTGDLGHLDDRGRMFITDRKKEILVLASGKNINPC
jgi:long-chain acyl-CoA synthetase